MGNQCCSATNVNDQNTTSHTKQPQTFDEEEQGQTMQQQETQKEHMVHAQMQEEVNEQVNENNENEVEVAEYVFKRQLEDLRLAISNADNLKNIAHNGKLLTQAISQVEVVIQLLSQNMSIPAYVREFKSDIIGLYGDLQMFRAFHLRYTMDQQYFNCLNHITQLANFFRHVAQQNYKDSKYNFDAIFKELQNGETNQQFEQLKDQFGQVRSIYNQISGQNFSTLPNYLYITFNEKPGFKLWNLLFPHDFEVSNKYFSKLYSEQCGVSQDKILQLISLLDNSNDQRVDIYQFVNFVSEYKDHLDEEGQISASKINNFSEEIQNKNKASKIAPRKSDEGEYIFPSGMRYRGDVDNQNRRQGKGKLTDEDYEFEGNYQDDLPSGYGRETRKRVVYEGNFKDGLYHGQGILSFPNGRQYNGQFHAHQFHGQGELIGDDGIRYNGEWKQGHLEMGKIIYHDGSYYQGQIFNSFFKDGKGTLVVNKPSFNNNAPAQEKAVEYIEGTWEKDAPKHAKVYNLMIESQCYEGEMSNWSITGRGKRIYNDGTYDGELLRDKKHNQGTLTYKNGDKFTGQWFEDQQMKGIYNYSKEKDHFYDGEWKNGVMEGQGKFSYQSGGVYNGQVKDGKRHGKGTYQYSNGNKYEGQWHENNQHGEGTFTYAVGTSNEGGDVYKGQFKNGKFNGFGHYYYKKSGKQYMGNWEDDKWSGLGKFFSADGKTIKAGIWKNDKLDSQREESEIKVPEGLQHLVLHINHQQQPQQQQHH